MIAINLVNAFMKMPMRAQFKTASGNFRQEMRIGFSNPAGHIKAAIDLEFIKQAQNAQ